MTLQAPLVLREDREVQLQVVVGEPDMGLSCLGGVFAWGGR